MPEDTPSTEEMSDLEVEVRAKEVLADLQSTVDTAEITTRFTYHKPTEEQANTYTELRDMAKQVAQFIIDKTPKSREQSLALTKLEEAVMWANAAIARRT